MDLDSSQLVQLEPRPPAQPRLPEWLRKGATHFQAVDALKREIRGLKLHTVCESARCPNLHECFSRGAATFMILGNLCTRGCGFCSVPKGSPHKKEFTLDPNEPANVARAIAVLSDLLSKAQALGETELESDPGFQSALKGATTRLGLRLSLDAIDHSLDVMGENPLAATAVPALRNRLAEVRRTVAKHQRAALR